MKTWGIYLSTRLAIGVVDVVLDITISVLLFQKGFHYLACLVLGFPFLALVFSCISVTADKWIRGVESLSQKKFAVITLTRLVELYEPFFESAPELILQFVIIWRGVFIEEIQVTFDSRSYGSPDWFTGLVLVFSIFTSIISLIVTTLFYNRQAEKPAGKFISALLGTIGSIFFRGFIYSILFAHVPGPAFGVIVAIYFINLATMAIEGSFKRIERFFCSYCSIISPFGYGGPMGSPSKNGSIRTTSELERTKIHQETLFRRVRVSYALHGILNIVLIIVYIALVEVYYLPHMSWVGPDAPQGPNMIQVMQDRRYLYTFPIILWFITTSCFGWHLQQVQRGRDDARANYNQTRRYKEGDDNGTVGTSNGSTVQSSIVRNQRAQGAYDASAPPAYEEASLLPSDERKHSLPLVASKQYELPNDTQNIGSEYGSGTIYHQKHQKHGTYKFHEEGCITCEVIREGKSFRSKMTGKNYMFMSSVSCMDQNCIYLVTCTNEKCGRQYVGKTEQELRNRHYEHKKEIDLKLSPLGKHFTDKCGYDSFQIQVIDQVRGEDNVERLRKELERREGYWQNELMTFVPWGLNIRDELNGIDISATSTNDFDGTSDVTSSADAYHFNAQEQVNGSNIDVV